jgi:micrococcal nuclease
MYHYKVLSVEKVVDGDTVDVVIDLGFSLYTKQRVRILGIDAPEIRTRDPKEKERGEASKEFAEAWFSDGEFTVQTTKDDKYGRILGDFRKVGEEMSYSESVLSEGFGVPYPG